MCPSDARGKSAEKKRPKGWRVKWQSLFDASKMQPNEPTNLWALSYSFNRLDITLDLHQELDDIDQPLCRHESSSPQLRDRIPAMHDGDS